MCYFWLARGGCRTFSLVLLVVWKGDRKESRGDRGCVIADVVGGGGTPVHCCVLNVHPLFVECLSSGTAVPPSRMYPEFCFSPKYI